MTDIVQGKRPTSAFEYKKATMTNIYRLQYNFVFDGSIGTKLLQALAGIKI